MALTSVAGATLTKLQTGGAGFPVPVSFTTQSYCGWIKKPSSGVERMLFDHDGKLQIKISNTDKITLVLDGVNIFSGPTTLPDNKWIFWGFKRSAGNIHTVTIRWVDCIVNVPVLQPLLTEINVVQAFAGGNPTQFTLHIPANCSICNFQYGNSTTNLTNSASSWGSGDSTRIWRTQLRFPGDLYDHREISVSGGDMTFAGMHAWSTITGSIILDSDDPGHLLDKICSAVIGYASFGAGLDTAHAQIPENTPPGAAINNTVPLPITILTNVLPATAVVDRVSIGARAQQIDPGTGAPFAFSDSWGFYRRVPDPIVYGPYQFAGEQYGYYDWTFFGAPNFANAPAGVNPSTGLPWTLADYYASIYYAGQEWSTGGGVGSYTCLTIRTLEAGIGVLYYGQTTPGVCGAGPPPSTGTIIVIKNVIE